MRLRSSLFIIAFLAVASVVSALSNFSIDDVGNNLIGVETRRKKENGNGRARSTSSSSGEKSKKGSQHKSVGSSLDMTDSSGSSSGSSRKKRDRKKYVPKSTEERKGWRKWHRKCTPCPTEMVLKWREPSVKWICGGYQRARRSFKSACLMRYRNCQDGTMFVKLYSHRCKNDTDKMERPHGEHFFYDYKVSMSDESSSSKDDSSTDLTSSSSVKSSSSSDELSKEKRRVMVHQLRATSDNSTDAAKINAATTTSIKT